MGLLRMLFFSPFPFMFAIWNVDIMAGVPAAILNHEGSYILGIVDQRSGRSLGSLRTS